MSLKIRIEWPEKRTIDIWPLEEILQIYTREEIEAGFMGKLDGDAWFSLTDDDGQDVFGWKHELNNFKIGK